MIGTQVTGKPKYVAMDTPGFVYAMRFRNGVVKIGRTTNLTKRKGQHALNAKVHDNPLTEVWSVWVTKQKLGEKRAVSVACALPETAQPMGTGSLEWWRGADYDVLIADLEKEFGKGTRREETE